MYGTERVFTDTVAMRKEAREKAKEEKKKLRLTHILKAKLSADDEALASALIDSLIAQGMAGNVVAIRDIMDRVDGKPKEEVELTGTVNVVFAEWSDGHKASS